MTAGQTRFRRDKHFPLDSTRWWEKIRRVEGTRTKRAGWGKKVGVTHSVLVNQMLLHSLLFLDDDETRMIMDVRLPRT